MENMLQRLKIIFQNDSLVLHQYDDSFKGSLLTSPMNNSDWSVWRKGHLAFGGLLGKTIHFSFKQRHLKVLKLFKYLHIYDILFKIQKRSFEWFTSPSFSGESEDQAGSNFLRGCLEKIQVQGNNVDLDLAFKYHTSISSHSCPAYA